MQGWRLGEECLDVAFARDLLLQSCLIIAGQPPDDLINLRFCAILAFGFLNIQRIHTGELGCEDPMLSHAIPPEGWGLRIQVRQPGSVRFCTGVRTSGHLPPGRMIMQ